MRLLIRPRGRGTQNTATKGMFTVSEVMEATDGRLILGEASGAVAAGVSTDTRTLKEGDLFVALEGPRFDGHAFLTGAFERGAVGAVISVARHRIPESEREQGMWRGRFVVGVQNTLAALQGLGRYHRLRFDLPVVAITGSNGKTTVKEMTAWILSRDRRVLQTEGNLNNQIGVPLTLLRLERRHRAAVVEMGINRPGELRALARIAVPRIGVVTNIGPTHLEGLGSLEAVAQAKAELLESLPGDSGLAVLNRDDPFFEVLKAKSPPDPVTFGLSSGAHVRATGVAADEGSVSFRLSVDPGIVGRVSGRPRSERDLSPQEPMETEIRLPLPGVHNVSNALAAAAAASILGSGIDRIKEALESFPGMAMRSELIEWNGVRIINDAYNANPASMAAALGMLSAFETGGRRIAVLGDMLELGGASEDSHRELGRKAASVPGLRLVTVGEWSQRTAEAAAASGLPDDSVAVCDGPESAAGVVKALVRPGDVVLVKGSRGMHLERLIRILTENG